MTRKIKAQDLKPGMKIEWTEYGWTHSGTVSEVQDPNRSSLFISFRAADELWMCVDKDLKVTVLKEPQPEEPTAFGACVKAGEVRFFRINTRGALRPWLSDGGGSRSWNELLSFGPVVIMCADPFATPAQNDTDPQVWARWEDVPDMTPVRSTTGNVYRKAPDGTELQTLAGEWWPSILATSKIRSLAPFTEVRDA